MKFSYRKFCDNSKKEPTFQQKWSISPINRSVKQRKENESSFIYSIWTSIKTNFFRNGSSDSLYSRLQIEEDNNIDLDSSHRELSYLQLTEIQKSASQYVQDITEDFIKENEKARVENVEAPKLCSVIAEPLCSLINLSVYIRSSYNIRCCIKNLNIDI